MVEVVANNRSKIIFHASKIPGGTEVVQNRHQLMKQQLKYIYAL